MKRIVLFIGVVLGIYTSGHGSEDIGHECGIALVRLRRPLSYYRMVHGSYAWGAFKLGILLREQDNRGQDGAGMAVMKFDMPPGKLYLQRMRYAGENSVDTLLNAMQEQLQPVTQVGQTADEINIKQEYDSLGEVYVGHVRYATHSTMSVRCCQPYICKNSVASKNFALAGNFNMTNCNQLCEYLTQLGLTPTSAADTHVILEMISYCLKQQHNAIAQRYQGLESKELADTIAREIDIVQVMHMASEKWDGGYVFAGILGNGDAFVCRDPAGIRPGFFYINEEVIAAASERVALVNAFHVEPMDIQELKPGFMLVIKRDGSYYEQQFAQLLSPAQCSFERIYFSRSCDPAIYQERKMLGKNLAFCVMDALGSDMEHAIFTYVPNSSEPAFMGLVEQLNEMRMKEGKLAVRVEKLIYKNQRLRTFIANAGQRTDLVARLYTVMRGLVSGTNTLVVVDDSIVRGTTLRESLIRELAKLNPKKIIIVSSAPPVLYPDCYGIDMSQISSFVGFQAAVALLKEQGKQELLEQIYQSCILQNDIPPDQMQDYVQHIYAPFTLTQLSSKIAQLVRTANLEWKGDIQIIYQTVEGLHAAIPVHQGDWYFTGNYPTPGGKKVVNTSYINWYLGSQERAY